MPPARSFSFSFSFSFSLMEAGPSDSARRVENENDFWGDDEVLWDLAGGDMTVFYRA